MLTGDNRTSAVKAVGPQKTSHDEVKAEVLPEDKGKVIQQLRMRGRVVCYGLEMVVNGFAPAFFSNADVVIAMGTGKHGRGHRKCGITLLRGDLMACGKHGAIIRGNQLRNIRQNLFFAFIL